MSKILQSLPMTIVAGVVLTVILAFVTDAMIASSQPDTGAPYTAPDSMNDMNQ